MASSITFTSAGDIHIRACRRRLLCLAESFRACVVHPADKPCDIFGPPINDWAERFLRSSPPGPCGRDGAHLQHETSPPQRPFLADWPAAAVSGGPEQAADLAACSVACISTAQIFNREAGEKHAMRMKKIQNNHPTSTLPGNLILQPPLSRPHLTLLTALSPHRLELTSSEAHGRQKKTVTSTPICSSQPRDPRPCQPPSTPSV
jgi:hypothetical protein